MKIGIQTWGSNGDVRPLLALATGLEQAGHDVSLYVSSIDNRSYLTDCRERYIEYRQIPQHIDFDLEDFAQRSFRMHPLQWLQSLLEEAFFPYEDEIFAAATELCAKHDILIGHHFLYPLKLAARLANKPFVSVTFCHAAILNPAVPPFGFPDLGLSLNSISWRLMNTAVNWTLKKPLSRLWLKNGHAVPRNILTEHLTSPLLNLVAVDPVFCSSTQYWSANHHLCGFFNFTEDTNAWEIPAGLTEFLNAGPPPVYMTFGSVQQAVPEWSMALFLDAAALAGCRAIIQTSSPRYPAGILHNDNVYIIGRHPHQPVFERCAAVVHHGGAGTTHAATRAGCPSVTVPFMDEQLFWGKQLQRLHLAGKPIPAKSASADVLAKSLRMISQDEKFSRDARQTSITMKNQNGVNEAVKSIERIAPSNRSTI